MSETTESPSLAEVPEVSVTTIIESIPDAVIIAEFSSNNIVAANDAAAKLFDCRTEDLVGLDRRELHPGTDTGAYEEAFHRGFESDKVERLADGSPLYIETRRGERTPVEINAQRIEADDRLLVLGVFRDISTRVERENQLKQTTARLNALVDATPFPVAVLALDGTIQMWNQAAEETFGYAAEELVDSQYPFFIDDDQFTTLFERVTDGETLAGHETVHRARDGSRLDVELYARPLYEDGEMTGVIGSAIDVTDRKRRGQQLDILRRLLRHNLRNKLTVIQGYASMLQADPSADEETIREMTEKIVIASTELSELGARAVDSRTLGTVPDSTQAALSTLLTDLRGVDDSVANGTVTVPAVDSAAVISEPVCGELSRLLTHSLAYMERPAIEVAVDVRDSYVILDIHGEVALLAGGDAELIRNGTETDLRHGSGLDVARTYLTVTGLGGDILLLDDKQAPHSLRVEIPRLDAA